MVSKPRAKKIIFYRIGAIGDIIHTLPLVKLTRELNPLARIEYILGSGQVAELVKNYSAYIDKVHVIEHGGVFDKPAKLSVSQKEKDLIAGLNKNQADEFIYLHGNLIKAHLLNKRFVKAKKLYIYKRDEKFSAVANYALTRYPDLKDELKEDAYKVLDCKTLKAKKASAASSGEVEKSISIVLGVGKLRPSRAYPLKLWVELIEKLLTETSYQINILGGPDELELSQEFETLIKQREKNLNYHWLKSKPDFSRVKNLIGKTSLLDLAQILKNTDKLFSADTGILHMAAALGTSISSVFSITSEKRFGPFNPQAEVLRSSSCSCQQSYSNLPKHCQNQSFGYARCVYDVDFSQAYEQAGDRILNV